LVDSTTSAISAISMVENCGGLLYNMGVGGSFSYIVKEDDA